MIRLANRNSCALLLILAALCLNACTVVKPWQRAWLEDPDMELKTAPNAWYEQSFQTYREGASGATGAKAGGGCGCN